MIQNTQNVSDVSKHAEYCRTRKMFYVELRFRYIPHSFVNRQRFMYEIFRTNFVHKSLSVNIQCMLYMQSQNNFESIRGKPPKKIYSENLFMISSTKSMNKRS